MLLSRFEPYLFSESCWKENVRKHKLEQKQESDPHKKHKFTPAIA